MTSDVFSATEALMEDKGVDVSITDMVLFSGTMGNPFVTCDVSGSFWADVDTIDDLFSVDRLLKEINGRGI